MMTTKTHNFECCMCGDHGLSHELFRCKVCHFRSQHRYCSNLYPKAESYRVCNWCLIQKDDNHTSTTTTTTTSIVSNNNFPNSSSPAEKHSTKSNKLYNHLGGPKAGPGPKGLQPISPIKKPMMIRSPEAQSPTGRKRITAVNCPTKDDRLRRTKSSEEMSNNYSTSSSSRSSGGGGQGVIKHVFRNKVRRYKLLDEVSS